MSQLRNLYLFFYNLLQALGWALSLFRILSTFFSTKSINGTFSSAGELILVQELPSVFITFVAWSLSEVIRYSHYALNCIGSPPHWITFMRYNTFIFLYPIGIFPGEMWLMYQALPYIKEQNLYADSLPFSYSKFIMALLFCYPFLWMKLYLHLFKQRRSKLGKQPKKKRN
ncbi:hypothetical protein CASFOL_030426 [Castilleja foliolosa]|uniref:Very-long-chain (3R)-3-hydroxyacyl-CoA dehydratase n=1 Tax=Castilleja foliolosa TaxID=1961234 RepID=A0ABD3C8K2_9LAMI